MNELILFGISFPAAIIGPFISALTGLFVILAFLLFPFLVHKFQILGKDSAVIAQDMGASLVPLKIQESAEQRLQNVVEEIAIASGLPVPQIYLLPGELGINVFAAGHSHEEAIFVISEGCLRELNRDQLQAVVAHLFSTLLYGETRFNLQLYALSHGILLIYNCGRQTLETSLHLSDSQDTAPIDRSDSTAQPMTVLYMFAVLGGGLTLMLAGIVGLVGDRLVKSMISRQQIYAADTASIRLTRYPQALVSALQQIERFQKGSYLKTLQAEVGSHLFFSQTTLRRRTDVFTDDIGDLLLSGFSSIPLLAIHPPLQARSQRLQALFTIHPEPTVSSHQSSSMSPTASSQSVNTGTIGDNLGVLVGAVETQHLNFAKSLLADLSPPIQTALKHPQGAAILVYGLLLAADPEQRQKQIQLLSQTENEAFMEIMSDLIPDLHSHLPDARLSLIELSIPALRQRSSSEFSHFMDQVNRLIDADGYLSFTEYIIQLLLAHRLQSKASDLTWESSPIGTLTPVWQDCVTVLSTLASVNHSDSVNSLDALHTGLAHLSQSQPLPDAVVPYSFERFGASLQTLKRAVPSLKQRIIDACGVVILQDKTVSAQEAELLRVLVITLGCPLPPLLQITTQPPNMRAANAA